MHELNYAPEENNDNLKLIVLILT